MLLEVFKSMGGGEETQKKIEGLIQKFDQLCVDVAALNGKIELLIEAIHQRNSAGGYVAKRK